MSVLIYAETGKGKIKKASLEAVYYGSQIASQTGQTATVLIANADAAMIEELGKCGAGKVLSFNNASYNGSDSVQTSSLIEQAVKSENSKLIIFPFDITGKAVAPRLSARLRAGMVAGAVDFPKANGNSLEVKKNVFSGKATAVYSINTEVKIISLLPNSFQVARSENKATVVEFSADCSKTSGFQLKETKSTGSGGMIPLPEAELVVSAGRGLKGPENWGMVEKLAQTIGATTACSRPVSDMHWRPHHEHVGQTGLAIRPNLYIAIGISGAIQHLAGVNGSKTIVVINNDKEAPFFKAADYGIVGDAFEILPKLIASMEKFKAGNN